MNLKKFIKNNILGFIIGAILFSGITVYASYQYSASQIGYKTTNVEAALNDLYGKTGNQPVCIRTEGVKETVSSKYACELGDGVARNFYIIAVNGNTVKMIMERNISDTVGSNILMQWNDALAFFSEGNPGYNLKQTWLTKVQSVDLPDAQDIVNAGEITGWDASIESHPYFGGSVSTRGNYAWLYNYSRNCTTAGCTINSDSPGYWTKTNFDETKYWCVSWDGMVEPYLESRGVRPVITLSKSQLAN